jgi:hypothetical protein
MCPFDNVNAALSQRQVQFKKSDVLPPPVTIKKFSPKTEISKFSKDQKFAMGENSTNQNILLSNTLNQSHKANESVSSELLYRDVMRYIMTKDHFEGCECTLSDYLEAGNQWKKLWNEGRVSINNDRVKHMIYTAVESCFHGPRINISPFFPHMLIGSSVARDSIQEKHSQAIKVAIGHGNEFFCIHSDKISLPQHIVKELVDDNIYPGIKNFYSKEGIESFPLPADAYLITDRRITYPKNSPALFLALSDISDKDSATQIYCSFPGQRDVNDLCQKNAHFINQYLRCLNVFSDRVECIDL